MSEVWIMMANDSESGESYVEGVYLTKERAEQDREVKKTYRANRGIKFPIHREEVIE